MFKRMLSAFGVGGPSVDTVLDTPHVAPGRPVTGQVRILGGSADVTIGQVVLSLVTRVEFEYGDHESRGTAEFDRLVVAGNVRVPAGQPVNLPFQLLLPWETPLTAFGSAPLHGMTVGVRTELVIAAAPDKGDLDPLAVQPLPSQARVLEAFGQLGFTFRSADVEAGRLYGVPQQLGFYQEIEFFPPAGLSYQVKEVELTFVATPHELYVVLEADRRGGAFSSGGDAFGHFAMSHEEAARADWATIISQWLEQVAHRYGPGYHPGHDYHGQGGHHHGSGLGGAVAGAAAGFAGGMIMGEVFEEIFEGDEGGEEE
jgi:sporulation-control protein